MKSYLIILLICITGLLNVRGQGIDVRLLQNLNGAPANAGTWRNVSNSVYVAITITPATMLVTGLATHNRELTIEAFETGASVAVAAGLSMGLKSIVHRQRPFIQYPGIITAEAAANDYSFPSAHTSTAFALATSLSLSSPKWYVIAPSLTYAGVVGYSRMSLGVHYPSDVFAGALVGAGSSFLTWKLQKLLNKKYHYH